MVKFSRAIAGVTVSAALVLAAVAGPAAAVDEASPSPSASPTATPTPSASATAQPCSANTAMANPDLAKLYAYVVNVETGEVLINERGTYQTPSASVLKVLSVSAALTYLPTDYKATTKVFTVPGEPGTIVLKGGGDHTLSQVTKDGFTTYERATRMFTLANKVYSNWTAEVPISKIILDSSFFSGPSYNPAWKASDRTNGYISKITALQTDADRASPDLSKTDYSGYRSNDPIGRTGNLFKTALGGLAKKAKIVEGKTPAGAVLLTSIESQPITTWMDHATVVSDNTETEFIARHAAKATGRPAAFSSIEPMVKEMLTDLGIDSSKLIMKDGSGLAQANRVTPKLITELMVSVANGHPTLAPLESYLPVAGVKGGLAYRFTGKNISARGAVKGKTGFIPGLYSLAGVIDAADGSRLAYSIFARTADGKYVNGATRGAIDTLATRFYTCGANLTE
ncbi:D-alanyl-D-alanine carboxypeptidase/D-alanyl-D-alanine endopeptidase [Rhodoluna limnophila]|uniref:D-alanyl-D-alanine carboxypeptidase/D-alanyl-D-alanine endopeptidase n=1 Tax=Rhodoluna limnophila TaxID=232537 RepID=UPI0011064165|nr:D-alanyl-D-alanine carboxypeptidase/D-alanyl-D-alanine-endopeptidase [Rhodoluna limnophila]